MNVDLLGLLSGLELWQWLVLSTGVAGWLGLTSWLGGLTEKYGGDRESGALIGFCAPWLLGLLVWWFI